MKLIGLLGPARVGKDTVGQLMVDHHNFRQYAFADPIRKACSEMFGLPVSRFMGNDPDRDKPDPFWGISPREMLQKLGTEGGRNLFRDDLWIKRAEQEWNIMKVDGFLDDQSLDLPFWNGMVITDVRFRNEAEWIITQGGSVVRVFRPNRIRSVRDHASEQEIEQCVFTHKVVNDGSISYLHSKVFNVVQEIMTER